MYLIDITKSYSNLVQKQLNATDADYVKVYSLGITTVVYTENKHAIGIILENHEHNIHQDEIDLVVSNLVKLPDTNYTLTGDSQQHVIELHFDKLNNK